MFLRKFTKYFRTICRERPCVRLNYCQCGMREIRIFIRCFFCGGSNELLGNSCGTLSPKNKLQHPKKSVTQFIRLKKM